MTNQEITLYHIKKDLEFAVGYKTMVFLQRKKDYYNEFCGKVHMTYFLGFISEEDKNNYKQEMQNILELEEV